MFIFHLLPILLMRIAKTRQKITIIDDKDKELLSNEKAWLNNQLEIGKFHKVFSNTEYGFWFIIIANMIINSY
jgi:hypothetical protein